ncbi:MAG: hypothetical protein ACYS5W_14365 [Planctomycetota bacterium]
MVSRSPRQAVSKAPIGFGSELAGGSTPISATSIIRRFDWTTGKISQQAKFTGVISEGSLRLLHELDATLLYALGTNSSRVPTNAQLFHTLVRTNIRYTVDAVVGTHILLAAAPVAAVAAGKCKWSGTVSKRCVCVGQTSILKVKIRKGSSPNETIEVAIKANNKPGCYDVCLGGKVKAKRIRVLKITGPTFRNNGKLSGDNKFRNGKRRKDKSLGAGIDPFRRGAIKNVMELQWKVEGVDAKCKCKIDITRTKTYNVYHNGRRTSTGTNQSDDRNNADEDRTPSAAGNIYSVDSPGLQAPLPGGRLGASIEQHVNFEEWVRIRVDGKWIRCTPKFKWQTHLVVTYGSRGWSLDKTRSDISSGHGSLSSRLP